MHLKQKLLLGQHTPQVEVAQLHVGLDQLCSCFTRDMLVQKNFQVFEKDCRYSVQSPTGP